jgi:hypothetical protein
VKIVLYLDNGDTRMQSLVELAHALEKGSRLWQGSVAAGSIDWSLDGDPLHIDDGRPFIDRAEFRKRLPRLGSLDTPLCTVVKGEDGYGKSYLHKYCKKLVEHWASPPRNMLRVGITECPSGQAKNLDPDVPALELSSGLGLKMNRFPRRSEDPYRFARNLASWIATETPVGPLPALAILDGYGDSSESVHLFIEELVRIIQSEEEVGKKLRVILLDYDTGRLDRKELKFALYVLEHVGDEEIGGWFQKRYPGQAGFHYEDAVDTIREQVREDGPLRMRNINVLMQLLSAGFEAP